MSPSLRRLPSQRLELSLGVILLGQIQRKRLPDCLDGIVAVGIDKGFIFELHQMSLPKAFDHGRYGNALSGPLLPPRCLLCN